MKIPPIYRVWIISPDGLAVILSAHDDYDDALRAMHRRIEAGAVRLYVSEEKPIREQTTLEGSALQPAEE